MIVENGRICPLIIAVGRLKCHRVHRYAVTLPWFSTWVDISNEVHEDLKMDARHGAVVAELQDAVTRVFDFRKSVPCFFWNGEDGPRLWGSFA